MAIRNRASPSVIPHGCRNRFDRHHKVGNKISLLNCRNKSGDAFRIESFSPTKNAYVLHEIISAFNGGSVEQEYPIHFKAKGSDASGLTTR